MKNKILDIENSISSKITGDTKMKREWVSHMADLGKIISEKEAENINECLRGSDNEEVQERNNRCWKKRK